MSDLFDITADEAPFDETPDTALTCDVCGKPIEWAGRGRKPKKCDEHKRARSSGGTKLKTSNESLAAQATEVLVQANSLIVLAAMVMGFHKTGSGIAAREDVFREQVYSALITDPALCRSIVTVKGISAKAMLAIAYLMLGAGVVPIAIEEYREKRDAKRAETEAAALAAEAEMAA